MREAPGYAFAVSMAVATTLVAGFALATLATLVTVSGVLADTNARLREANQRLAARNAQQLDPSRVCPAWWFGHSTKDIYATRKRMCGK